MPALGVKVGVVKHVGLQLVFFVKTTVGFLQLSISVKNNHLVLSNYMYVYICVCVCVYIYIYIYVVGLGMCFFVIKVQYTPVVIWKLWYYSLYGTIFVQTRLYESFLLLLQIVSKQIFPIQIVWKLLLWNGYYGMHR